MGILGHWLKVHNDKEHQKAPHLISKLIYVLIYVIGIIMIMAFFGIQITPLLATLGVGGIAIGLALQPTLINFFAGLNLISDKPVQVGDFIEIENGQIQGFVLDIGWRSTRIKTLANAVVIIPNTKLSENIIVNSTQIADNQYNVVVPCAVSYGADLEKVEKILIDVSKKIIKKYDDTVKDFEPIVRYNTFADSNINFNVIIKVNKYTSQFLLKHELIKAIKNEFDKEKIEISYPVRKIVYAKK